MPQFARLCVLTICCVAAEAGAIELPQLEQKLLQAVQCNAKSSIWLQDATFSLAQLKLGANEAGKQEVSAELITVYPVNQKQEKSALRAVLAADRLEKSNSPTMASPAVM